MSTTGDLHDELARLGAKLMPVALGALERGSLTLTPQAETGATYAAKIDKTETRIDWTRPWQEVHNHCRGLSPFPGAWFEHPGLGRIKVLRTTKGEGQGAPGAVLDDRLTDRLRRAAPCGSSNCNAPAASRCGRKSFCAARPWPSQAR